jgi:hypothetical protein
METALFVQPSPAVRKPAKGRRLKLYPTTLRGILAAFARIVIIAALAYPIYDASEELRKGAESLGHGAALLKTRIEATAEAMREAPREAEKFKKELARIDAIGKDDSLTKSTEDEVAAMHHVKEARTLNEKLKGAFGWNFGDRISDRVQLDENGTARFQPSQSPYKRGFVTCREDRTVYEIMAYADPEHKDAIVQKLKKRYGAGEQYEDFYSWENDEQEIHAIQYEGWFAVCYTDKTLRGH